jgi:hypothetical protein
MKPVLAASAMLCLLTAGAGAGAQTVAPVAPAPAEPVLTPPAPPPPPAPAPATSSPPPYYYVPAATLTAPGAGFHQHDGFFARGHFGIGVTSLSATRAGVKNTLSGGALALGGAVGGVVARNLILYGAFFVTDVGNPNLDVGGTSTATDVTDVSFGGFGPGVAYYFEPINLYLSGTLGLSAFQASDSAGVRRDSSKTGLALELSVGKEWWASHDWGLGLAAQLLFASVKDQDDPSMTWSIGSLSLLFSATYN